MVMPKPRTIQQIAAVAGLSIGIAGALLIMMIVAACEFVGSALNFIRGRRNG